MKKIEILKKALIEEAPMCRIVKTFDTFEEYRESTFIFCRKRTTREVDGLSVDFYDPELNMEEVNAFIKGLKEKQ